MCGASLAWRPCGVLATQKHATLAETAKGYTGILFPHMCVLPNPTQDRGSDFLLLVTVFQENVIKIEIYMPGLFLFSILGNWSKKQIYRNKFLLILNYDYLKILPTVPFEPIVAFNSSFWFRIS